MLRWLVSSEDPLFGLQMAIFFLCPHLSESRERQKTIFFMPLLLRTLIFMALLPSKDSFSKYHHIGN